MYIQLDETDCSLIEKKAHCISTGDGDFYFFPYWLKKQGKNVFEEVLFENLPQTVKDMINKNRDRQGMPRATNETP